MYRHLNFSRKKADGGKSKKEIGTPAPKSKTSGQPRQAGEKGKGFFSAPQNYQSHGKAGGGGGFYAMGAAAAAAPKGYHQPGLGVFPPGAPGLSPQQWGMIQQAHAAKHKVLVNKKALVDSIERGNYSQTFSKFNIDKRVKISDSEENRELESKIKHMEEEENRKSLENYEPTSFEKNPQGEVKSERGSTEHKESDHPLEENDNSSEKRSREKDDSGQKLRVPQEGEKQSVENHQLGEHHSNEKEKVF